MANYRHLSNPPIHEAVFELRVVRQPNLDVKVLSEAQEALGSDYSEAHEIRALNFKLNLPSGSTRTQDDIDGYRYESIDKTKVIQFRADRFAFSMIRSYYDWEQLESKAWKSWTAYLKFAKPRFISRIGTRFINFIDIPIGANVDDYLAAAPKAPPKFEGERAGFHSRINLQATDGYRVTLNQVLDYKTENKIRIIIDIDAYILLEGLEIPANNEEQIRSYFPRLRKIKNSLFFDSVTDLALKPYL